MIIDFHVHVFPDKIAKKTIDFLWNNMNEIGGLADKPLYNGSVDGLKEKMTENNIDISVIMPIATKITQSDSINKFAEDISCDNIISFASLHPYQMNIDIELKNIVSRGFKGIKLHPDYQGVFADDEKFISLVKQATDLGLYVTIHAGEDAGILAPFHSTTEHLLPLLNKVDSSRVILAHLGAFNEWDSVENRILNFPVYIDISMVSRFIKIDQYERIINKCGIEKVLFGSDSPWENPNDTLSFLKKTRLSKNEIEQITHINAENILF